MRSGPGIVTRLTEAQQAQLEALRQSYRAELPAKLELIGGAVETLHAGGWEKADFDDSSWKTGESGFGTEGTPGAVVHTKWDRPDIWLRREIDLPTDALKDVELLVHHDDSFEAYINGALASRSKQYTTDYVEARIREEARKVLKPGKNLVAVHCHQEKGGQYIDLGFAKLTEVKRK